MLPLSSKIRDDVDSDDVDSEIDYVNLYAFWHIIGRTLSGLFTNKSCILHLKH